MPWIAFKITYMWYEKIKIPTRYEVISQEDTATSASLFNFLMIFFARFAVTSSSFGWPNSFSISPSFLPASKRLLHFCVNSTFLLASSVKKKLYYYWSRQKTGWPHTQPAHPLPVPLLCAAACTYGNFFLIWGIFLFWDMEAIIY